MSVAIARQISCWAEVVLHVEYQGADLNLLDSGHRLSEELRTIPGCTVGRVDMVAFSGWDALRITLRAESRKHQ